MGQVSVVELLTFQVIAVLARLQIFGLDAVGLEELLICDSKSLPNSLSYDLSLVKTQKRRKKVKWTRGGKMQLYTIYKLFHIKKMKEMDLKLENLFTENAEGVPNY